MKMYKKPIVTVDAGLAEGVYAASGAKGTLNVTYHGVWDRLAMDFSATISA